MEVRRTPSSMSELYHYGIVGMKWGVRRYQNPDGSLTAAGQARYTYNERKKSLKNVSNMSDDEIKKSVNRMNLEKQYRRATKENLKDTKEDMNSGLKTAGKVAAAAAIGTGAVLLTKKALKSANSYNNISKTISNLSTKELASKIDRLKLEKTYSDLVSDKISKGTSPLNKVLTTAGETVLSSAIAGTTAFALRTAITGKADAETAANYIAPSPNKKKK